MPAKDINALATNGEKSNLNPIIYILPTMLAVVAVLGIAVAKKQDAVINQVFQRNVDAIHRPAAAPLYPVESFYPKGNDGIVFIRDGGKCYALPLTHSGPDQFVVTSRAHALRVNCPL